MKDARPADLIAMTMGLMKGYSGSMTPERKIAFARERIHLALANAVNGAKALGLDSCPMGGFDPPVCRSAFPP